MEYNINNTFENSIVDKNYVDETALLPICVKVSAKTIASDLVAITPQYIDLSSYYTMWDPDKKYTVDEFFEDDDFEDYKFKI
jgi:hypothetical protein